MPSHSKGGGVNLLPPFLVGRLIMGRVLSIIMASALLVLLMDTTNGQYPGRLIQKSTRNITLSDSNLTASDSLGLPMYDENATLFIGTDTSSSPLGTFWPGYHLYVEFSDSAGANKWHKERLSTNGRVVLDTIVFETNIYVDLDSIMVDAEWVKFTVTADSMPDSNFTIITSLNLLLR